MRFAQQKTELEFCFDHDRLDVIRNMEYLAILGKQGVFAGGLEFFGCTVFDFVRILLTDHELVSQIHIPL